MSEELADVEIYEVRLDDIQDLTSFRDLWYGQQNFNPSESETETEEAPSGSKKRKASNPTVYPKKTRIYWYMLDHNDLSYTLEERDRITKAKKSKIFRLEQEIKQKDVKIKCLEHAVAAKDALIEELKLKFGILGEHQHSNVELEIETIDFI